MRVLMLGWEFPPFISGGLGTACYGLTKALSNHDVDVLFVLPKHIQGHGPQHIRLLSPAAVNAARPGRATLPRWPNEPAHDDEALAVETYQLDEISRATFKAIPSPVVNPYASAELAAARREAADAGDATDQAPRSASAGRVFATDGAPHAPMPEHPGALGHYDQDVIEASRRYAERCVNLVRGEEFDVIHAHDWMTFPAGLRLSALSGKPLVVHVHSTEFDRAGENVHQHIYEIERRGMHGAVVVLCVSYLTRNLCIHRYGVDPDKTQVVYNGIDCGEDAPQRAAIRKGDKIVLFLGRITMQKGPEYFVAAAKKVLEKVENVKFVMAGSGDRIRSIIEMAAHMGIGHKVLFTGFLRGNDVERVFRMADVYVMPSVSEPFGIAPLEAIRNDVPVIISRSSGVAEVLDHALKVDFWDTDDIANKIIAVLRHPPLSQTLREQADLEVRSLTWDGAAAKCVQAYRRAIDALQPIPVPVH